MIFRKSLIFVPMLLLSLSASGQSMFGDLFSGWPFGGSRAPALTQKDPVSFEYDIAYKYDFFNMEFDASHGSIVPSSTIHTSVMTPSVGISVLQSETVAHRLMVGIDIAKNMGENPVRNTIFAPDEGDMRLENTRLLREVTLYYRAQAILGKGLFTAYAGVFPRRFTQGEYSEAIFSDMYKVLDRNLEGMMLQYRTARMNAELACDWFSKYGVDRREKFQIFTAGEYEFTPWLSAGWDGSMLHFACSESANIVAYNNMLDVYLRLDLSHSTHMDEFSIKLGPKAIYQYQQDGGELFGINVAAGAESVLKLKKRSWGVQNTLFAGRDMMPLYDLEYNLNGVDSADGEILYRPYAGDLYTGSAFYHGASEGISFYDKLEMYYQPHLTRFLDLKVSVDFHITSGEYGFAGTQQKVAFLFDLDALRHPAIKFKKENTSSRRRNRDYKGGKINL
ncbi:MAG: hypothetical protein MJY83_00460 [Bacteroidales bacterium]|nr:hypothetical protein [Bacteroidales bacterium]